MRDDPSAWDERYSGSEFVWTTEPNRFLPPAVAGLVPGRALDLACGEGRNAVWLAGQGWTVTGVDFSTVGLEKGARLAEANGVDVTWVAADVTTFEAPSEFDLVIVFYLQVGAGDRRAALSAAARALAPGATLVLVAHDSANLTAGVGGPQDPGVLYTAADVVADLAGSGVAVEVDRAEVVRREVATPAGPRDALDCLVRARRAR